MPEITIGKGLWVESYIVTVWFKDKDEPEDYLVHVLDVTWDKRNDEKVIKEHFGKAYCEHRYLSPIDKNLTPELYY